MRASISSKRDGTAKFHPCFKMAKNHTLAVTGPWWGEHKKPGASLIFSVFVAPYAASRKSGATSGSPGRIRGYHSRNAASSSPLMTFVRV